MITFAHDKFSVLSSKLGKLPFKYLNLMAKVNHIMGRRVTVFDLELNSVRNRLKKQYQFLATPMQICSLFVISMVTYSFHKFNQNYINSDEAAYAF